MISCASYARLENPNCLDGLQITEGLCLNGTIRYRSEGGGYFSVMQFWNAATGALTFNTAPNFEAPGDANTDS